MTLTQLEHLRAADRAGSFSAAARACGVTQAALSNSIAKLEEELGERIFSRTTRRVSLSPFGARLLPHVEQILGARDALLGVAKAERLPATTVMGHSPLIPSHVLTQMVAAIREAQFGSEIRLVEENLTHLLQRLREHSIDIALIPEAEYGSSIRSAPVCEDPLFYVARRSRDTQAEEAELTSLSADTFVMVPDSCGLARATRDLFASAGVPLHVYGGEAMGYHVLQEWAALDLGSAILPRSRLAAASHAVPLLRSPGVPAVLTYRVAWHGEYGRGKALARLLRGFRAEPRAESLRDGPAAALNARRH